jgi:hypothetical protein
MRAYRLRKSTARFHTAGHFHQHNTQLSCQKLIKARIIDDSVRVIDDIFSFIFPLMLFKIFRDKDK